MPTEKKEKTTKMTTKKAEPVEKKTTTKKNTKPATKKETGTRSTAKKETSTKTTTKKTTAKKATTKKTEPSKKTEKKPTKSKKTVVEEIDTKAEVEETVKEIDTKLETEEVVEEVETKKEVKTVDMQEMQKVLKQEIKSKKTVTEEQQKKMNGEVFKNIIIAIAIVLFLNCIILGFMNIESSIFIVDLKVFAVSLLAVAIGIFEFAYKKDSGKAAIYGIEILFLALCMLAFIYIDIMLNSKFVIIAVLLTYAIAIYYTAKSIIVYKKMKKQYLIDSIKKEIVKK
jgi:uncharacterized membrane protein